MHRRCPQATTSARAAHVRSSPALEPPTASERYSDRKSHRKEGEDRQVAQRTVCYFRCLDTLTFLGCECPWGTDAEMSINCLWEEAKACGPFFWFMQVSSTGVEAARCLEFFSLLPSLSTPPPQHHTTTAHKAVLTGPRMNLLMQEGFLGISVIFPCYKKQTLKPKRFRFHGS